MKKLLLIFFVVAGFALVSTSAAMADEPEETVYDFEAEDLEGGLIRPDGEQIRGDDRGRTSSLINIREDFIPEMLESVESL